ncbi:MAG: ABC transporter substrate-binding protein, partial [Candidatus Gastranaerophilales bacterium]|nr:ABC transporter substrate-binding protein [Candidatus Gastranaerophilales bacterium]
MKRIGYVILIICIIALLFSVCIHKDEGSSSFVPDTSSVGINPYAVPIDLEYPVPVTKTINGVDYLQSRLPIGKFGGKLVSSTIGEGPKTFNPFTSTDATSSAMADMMYDGLFSTNPMNGEVTPKLAKSVEIKGNKYIVHLRRGIKWSDGKPITADDVMFTWKDIIFA